jgi:hypothetical protein
MTSIKAWPLPGILSRYDACTKEDTLEDLDRHICVWLSHNSSRTFNLLFRTKAGISEIFFVFRTKGVTRFPGMMKNEIGGCEAGGFLIIEDRQDFDNFPGETDWPGLVSEAGQRCAERTDKRVIL